MTTVVDTDLLRLIKLCGLLGSAAVGERAAAALKVTEWMQTHQLTWEDVLAQDEPMQAVTVTVGDQPLVTTAQLEEARTLAYGQGYQAGMQVGASLNQTSQARDVEVQKAYARGFSDGATAARPGPQPAAASFTTGRTWQEAVGDAWMHLDQIRASGRTREADFLDSLVARIARGQQAITAKQELWLRDICLRLGVEQW